MCMTPMIANRRCVRVPMSPLALNRYAQDNSAATDSGLGRTLNYFNYYIKIERFLGSPYMCAANCFYFLVTYASIALTLLRESVRT
jgi:hypothetical protein